MNGRKLIRQSPRTDTPYSLRSKCKTPCTTNESLYESTHSRFSTKKPLIYVSREDDNDFEYEENNNQYDFKQESEHRNYHEFLESGEEVYGRVDSCFRLCPVHCITPQTSTPLSSNQDLKSTSKSISRSNSQTRSRSIGGSTNSRSASNKSPEINVYSPSLTSNISNRLRSKCNCSKPSRSNMYGVNETTAMKIEERSFSRSKIKESIKEQLSKQSVFRNLHEISTKEASCGQPRSILKTRRRYTYFYEPYLDRAYLRWWALRNFIQYDLLNRQNVIKFVGYSVLMIIFVILHFLIKNDILISLDAKKRYKLAVWGCIKSTEKFIQYLILKAFGISLLNVFG